MLRFWFALLFCCVIGCANTEQELVVVTGVVLVDGKSADKVTVLFCDVDNEKDKDWGLTRHCAWGLTNAKGEFVLTTAGRPIGSGIESGRYHVTFEKMTLPNQYKNKTPDEAINQVIEKRKKDINGENFLFSFDLPVPLKYNKHETSGIDPVAVVKTGKNHFVFNLSTEK
ncbi:MAG: hypothetical protein LBC68_05705 [Prevotellaceae bacterium]|jgi:hypothetical protein|nr:hypothetical protein [Prevotellaceae bacterium]